MDIWEADDLIEISSLSHIIRAYLEFDDAVSEDDAQRAVSGIFDLCHNSRSHFKTNQNEAARLGIVDFLIGIVTQNETSNDLKLLSYRALGQMCFANESVSRIVGCSDELIKNVSHVLTSKADPDFKDEALYPLKNAAGNSWDTHPKLIELVPQVLEVFSSTHASLLRVQCLFFVSVLAYNPDSRPALLQAHTLDMLVDVMGSNRDDMFPTSAAVAVACLVGDQPNHPALEAGKGTGVMQQLCLALHATLDGHDFPQGTGTFYTGWKLMMGIANLCRNPANKQALRQAGLLTHVYAALASRKPEPRMVQYSLMALWYLCDEDTQAASHTHPSLASSSSLMRSTHST